MKETHEDSWAVRSSWDQTWPGSGHYYVHLAIHLQIELLINSNNWHKAIKKTSQCTDHFHYSIFRVE